MTETPTTTEIKNENPATTTKAAGSAYTTYFYQRQFDVKVVGISFVTRTPQCLNYDEPAQSVCKKEITGFDIDKVIDSIFSSVKLD